MNKLITVEDLLINDGFDIAVVKQMKPEEIIKADSIENWYEKEIYMAKITEKYGGTMYINSETIVLYDLLREQFDTIVQIIQDKFHIKCTNDFWKEVLQTYLVNRVFCEVVDYSLPCIFALRALQQHSCFGQQFEVDSDVYKAISKHPCVVWEDVPDKAYKMLNNKGNVLKLVFRSCNYQQKRVNGNKISESLHFCIDDITDYANIQTIFDQKIEFDETLNVTQYRDQTLLNIAKELMLPLNRSENKWK